MIKKGEKGPVIELSTFFHGRLHRPWEMSAIVKLFSKSLDYKTLCT